METARHLNNLIFFCNAMNGLFDVFTSLFVHPGVVAVNYLELTGMRQGTESRMQEPVPGSAGSTMTKGLSSNVTTRRCWESSRGFKKEP